MFGFLFKKQRLVESQIHRYLEEIRGAQHSFADAFKACLGEDASCDFDEMKRQTHHFEALADDVREEIKTLMYGKTLIPESRGDIMGLLEAVDEVPRYFERILNLIGVEQVEIPDFLASRFEELLTVSLESCDLMTRQVEELFGAGSRIQELIAAIDARESQCDVIERDLLSGIFRSDLDPFDKLQLKDLVLLMGDISDQADRVAKQVNIIHLKRRV